MTDQSCYGIYRLSPSRSHLHHTSDAPIAAMEPAVTKTKSTFKVYQSHGAAPWIRRGWVSTHSLIHFTPASPLSSAMRAR